MDNDLVNKTDEELQEIVRLAENANISGSRHSKALIELDIRHKKRMEANKNQVKLVAKSGKIYTILREIGKGGFGVVYLVEGEGKQHYALKFLSPLGDVDVRVQLEAEITSVLGLVHPNIIEIFDYGEGIIDSHLGAFIISEYCPDGNYRAKLIQGVSGEDSLKNVLSDIKQVLTGLKTLHSRTVHRDLKPENILISGDQLKLADFGLSKFVDEATRTLTFKGSGTPRYMAPEVWLKKHATPSSDLYSLGVIFYEALTGQSPFESEDIYELRNMHLVKPAPRVKDINPLIPNKIDGIVKKLLLKESEKRYQSAEEVLQAIDDAAIQPAPELITILDKARKFHDAQETQKSEHEIAEQKKLDEIARDQYKESEIVDMVASVIEEFNSNMPEIKITESKGYNHAVLAYAGRDVITYRLGNRTLVVHFFGKGELFQNPKVPGRMKTLVDNYVVHGGFIEIREDGQDRQGWNLYLIRKPEEIYGEWYIVETDLSGLSGKALRYPPMATAATLFADNLSCHLANVMHIYNLKSKKIERTDILKILDKFIP
jgi:serine/threonine protein kinase